MGRLEPVAHAPRWINADGDTRVSEVAIRSLQARLEPVQEFLPLAALKHDESIEYVHQLRVWTRRADAALDMYRELLPQWRAAWIEKQLARIRRATNDARDDDVLIRRLTNDQTPAAATLLNRVRQHRAEAQKSVMEVHERLTKKKRLDRRVEKLLQRVRLRGKRGKLNEPTFRRWAADHFRPILDEFFKAGTGDLVDTDRLHQFRILGKKLRYAMELLSAAFDAELRDSAYPLLEMLQNQLGQVNDHASALDRLCRWVEESEDAESTTYLCEMAEFERQQLNDSRQRFSMWWSVEQQSQLRDAFERVVGECGA